MLKRTLCLLAALLMAGCDSLTSPGGDGELSRLLALARNGTSLSTDSAAYTAARITNGASLLQYGFTAVVRYTNPTDETIYLARCYGDTPYPIYGVVPAQDPDGTLAAYNPMWACVGHDQQIAVAPRTTRVDTLRLVGPSVFASGASAGQGVTEGVFRLMYTPQRCRGDGACPIADPLLRFSNEFRVTAKR